jgi:uncharacterized protein
MDVRPKQDPERDFGPNSACNAPASWSLSREVRLSKEIDVFAHTGQLGKALAAAAFATLLAGPAAADLAADANCRPGAYALSDGRSAAIAGFDGSGRDLRFALSSGEYGRMAWTSGGDYALGAPSRYGSAAFPDCDTLRFHETGKAEITGHKIVLPATDTFFDSDGTRLHGKLVMPQSGKAGAIVVWVQGSDDDPASDDEALQYELPLKGIGVFVYDKRGTGKSGGELSADFYVRAADTAKAALEAHRLAPEAARIGTYGGSQGGWVAPLAATKARLDFVIVGYGLAEGVTAQDRDEVEEQVRAAGFGDAEIAKVREITAATARIVKSEWKSGYDELAALERKYQGEPWYKAIAGENGYTAIMLKTPLDQIKTMGPKLDKHVSFAYDPRPVIETISARQLWILGGADRTAPSARTIAILGEIQKKRHDLDVVVYKDADHGIVETFTSRGVERHRHPADLTDRIARWISGGRR